MKFTDPFRRKEQHSHQPGSEHMARRLLSVADAAAYCRVSESTIYRWIDTEGFKIHHLPSGRGARPIVRIRLDQLDDWLDNREVQKTENHQF